MEKDNFITSYGFFSTIVVAVIGIGIFSYPREVADLVGGDAWAITLGAGIINLMLLKLVIKALQAHNFDRITVIMRKSFGRFFGGILLLLLAAANITAISLGMRAFVEVVKMFLLDKTPTEFLLIITILTGLYLVRGGIRSNIKFNEITFWVMFIPMFLVLIFAVGMGDFSNLLPVFHNKPDNYLKALAATAFSFGGLEIVYLMAPLLKNKKKAYRTIIGSVSFVVIFYIIVTIICIAVFSTEGIRPLLWPTITMVRSINLAGTFVERWDGLVMALWIIFYFTTFSNGFTYSSYLVSDAVGADDIRISSLILIPFIYIIAMLPTNITELYTATATIMPINLLINLLIVPLLLLATGRRNREGKEGKT